MNRSFNNKAQTLRQSDLDAVEVKSKVSNMRLYFSVNNPDVCLIPNFWGKKTEKKKEKSLALPPCYKSAIKSALF